MLACDGQRVQAGQIASLKTADGEPDLFAHLDARPFVVCVAGPKADPGVFAARGAQARTRLIPICVPMPSA